jgi:hypothetical protein
MPALADSITWSKRCRARAGAHAVDVVGDAAERSGPEVTDDDHSRTGVGEGGEEGGRVHDEAAGGALA